jgi:hypothetical protein
MKKYLKIFTNSVEANIISELANAKSITIAFDSWTSRIGSHGFLAIVAHFIDHSFERREVLLGFEPDRTVKIGESVISTHTSLGQATLISNVLERFQIKKKLCFLLGDNASTNLAMAGEKVMTYEGPEVGSKLPFAGKYSFCRCLSHIVHLEASVIIGIFKESSTFDEDRKKDYYSVLKDAVTSMHTSPPNRKRWNDLCSATYKGRLLPREVATRWNAFDELLRVAIELKGVLEDYTGLPQNSGWWNFCQLIRDNVTVHLMEVTNICSSDTSLSALNLTLLDHLIDRLEYGVLTLACKVRELRKASSSKERNSNDSSAETVKYLAKFCGCYVDQLGMKLRNYYDELKRSKMEMLKFFLVPYNVDGYFKDAGLRSRLKFGDEESVKRFLIQCFLGEHEEIVLRATPDSPGFESGTPYQGDISLDRSEVTSNVNESDDEIIAVPSSPSDFDMGMSEEATCSTEVFSSPIKPAESNWLTISNEFEEDTGISVEPINYAEVITVVIENYLELCKGKYLYKPKTSTLYDHFKDIEKQTSKFWQDYDSTILKAVAQAVFSAPGSNSYVERIFSRVKEITTDRRNSLLPETVRDLVISKLSLQFPLSRRTRIESDFINKFVSQSIENAVTDLGMDMDAANFSEFDDLELVNPWSELEREKIRHLGVTRREQYFEPERYEYIKRYIK